MAKKIAPLERAMKDVEDAIALMDKLRANRKDFWLARLEHCLAESPMLRKLLIPMYHECSAEAKEIDNAQRALAKLRRFMVQQWWQPQKAQEQQSSEKAHNPLRMVK